MHGLRQIEKSNAAAVDAAREQVRARAAAAVLAMEVLNREEVRHLRRQRILNVMAGLITLAVVLIMLASWLQPEPPYTHELTEIQPLCYDDRYDRLVPAAYGSDC